ncbi:MAG TPA: sulfotransferase domain-containing protein [Caldilineaceae bacterium]|nr:sulfotransferase domain-containing protein [Caldilineaceae bacterium]
MSILWLASYPKSGNTWLRVFLTNYLRDGDEPACINDLDAMQIVTSRELFDTFCGGESSDMTGDEIDGLRPDVYTLLAATQPQSGFHKVHDAYRLLPDGRPLFPDAASRGAIYIARNPLAVAVSMRYHFNDSSYDESIQRLNTATWLSSRTDRIVPQLRHYLGSWSEHVASWLDAPKSFPVHLVRYEDLLDSPAESFAAILGFAGLPLEEDRLAKAIRFSSFASLQAQERSQGFAERAGQGALFFRRGAANGWQEELSAAQVNRVLAAHGPMMRRLGYWGQPSSVPHSTPIPRRPWQPRRPRSRSK